MAEADLALTRAQRRELDLRLARTEVRAPVDGIVSRRSARVGATASLAGEPLFRLIAHGQIELEGDVTKTGLGDVGVGAPALVDVGGGTPVHGRVRVVYPRSIGPRGWAKSASRSIRTPPCASAPSRAALWRSRVGAVSRCLCLRSSTARTAAPASSS